MAKLKEKPKSSSLKRSGSSKRPRKRPNSNNDRKEKKAHSSGRVKNKDSYLLTPNPRNPKKKNTRTASMRQQPYGQILDSKYQSFFQGSNPPFSNTLKKKDYPSIMYTEEKQGTGYARYKKGRDSAKD